MPSRGVIRDEANFKIVYDMPYKQYPYYFDNTHYHYSSVYARLVHRLPFICLMRNCEKFPI